MDGELKPPKDRPFLALIALIGLMLGLPVAVAVAWYADARAYTKFVINPWAAVGIGIVTFAEKGQREMAVPSAIRLNLMAVFLNPATGRYNTAIEKTARIPDTHTDIPELIKFGMPEPQAETIVRLIVRLMNHHSATKADIAETNANIEKLRLETRADIAVDNCNIGQSKNDTQWITIKTKTTTTACNLTLCLWNVLWNVLWSIMWRVLLVVLELKRIH